MTTHLVSRSFSSDTMLFDPVQKKPKSIPYIKKIYGDAVFKQLTQETMEALTFRRDLPDEAFSKELKETIRSICVRKFPDSGFEKEIVTDDRVIEDYRKTMGFSAKEIYSDTKTNTEVTNPDFPLQRQRQKGDDFFIMLERGVFRNPEFRKIFKGPFSVYAWLWSNIVREGWVDKPGYPIKKKFYDKGLLAYCSSYSKIAKECFMNKDTVKKYIDRFKEYGIINVDYIQPEGKKLEQCVYILGEWMNLDGGIHERLYLDHVLLSAKKDSIWDFDMGDEL